MQIVCDNCGAALEKGVAIVHEVEDGELYYFCSETCFESSDLRDEEDDERKPPG